MKAVFLSGLAMTAALAAVSRAEQRFESGPARTALIELYTSEGCSSCPPAERRLDSLRDRPGLWRDFVPIEFHVNYWDRLGWPDRFATTAFTERERTYAEDWGTGSVYTPCFVRNGAEWKNQAVPGGPDSAAKPVGRLALVLGENNACRVEFSPLGTSAAGGTYEVHVVWLGGGFTSRVTAGENRGEILRHEFVALALESHRLVRTDGTSRAEFTLAPPAIRDAPRRGLAAWITRRGDPLPLQATGGWLEK
jgi:hypothetical protein